jgi:hypothetical protein
MRIEVVRRILSDKLVIVTMSRIQKLRQLPFSAGLMMMLMASAFLYCNARIDENIDLFEPSDEEGNIHGIEFLHSWHCGWPIKYYFCLSKAPAFEVKLPSISGWTFFSREALIAHGSSLKPGGKDYSVAWLFWVPLISDIFIALASVCFVGIFWTLMLQWRERRNINRRKLDRTRQRQAFF